MTSPVSILDVDLTPFSLSRHRAWAGGAGVFVAILVWFLLLILVATSGAMQFAALLGILSFGLLLVGFVVTTVQRMSRSTAGQKRNPVEPEDLGKRPPHFDRTIGEIVAAVRGFARATGGEGPEAAAERKSATGSKRLRATLYVIGGVLVVLIGIPLLFAIQLGGGLLAVAVMLLVSGMYGMFTRARRVMLASAEQVTLADPRPPILFLRSFQDDRTKVMQRVTLAGLPAQQPIRLEEAMGLELREFGPFLAVGEPDEGLPQLGAARAYLSDDQWQAAVLAWIKSSRLVMMLCGPTSWIHWEMQNIIRNQRLGRLILVLPPGRKAPGSKTMLERHQRWTNVVQSLRETRFGAALTEIDIGDALLLQFRPDGRVFVFRSKGDLAQDYELALTLALYTAFSEPETFEALPLAQSTPAVAEDIEVEPSSVWKPTPYLAAKMALFGLLSGLTVKAGQYLGVQMGIGIPIVYLLIASVLAGGVLALGAWLLVKRSTTLASKVFAVMALTFFLSAYVSSVVVANLPYDFYKIGFLWTPSLLQWLITALIFLMLGSIALRGFRSLWIWGVTLGAAVALGLFGSVVFGLSLEPDMVGLIFVLVPQMTFAACMGLALARER